MNLGSVIVMQADARHLPILSGSIDLIVTSPPYFALRSYQDGGEHYDGQLGAEPTPVEYVDALLDVTRECVRVLQPDGSIWVNLGDKYADKSLVGIPWRYALACIDDLGLILRAEVIWSKPNGLPESVTDRVRRSHEQWFHFTLQPRYFSAVDEIREQYSAEGPAATMRRVRAERAAGDRPVVYGGYDGRQDGSSLERAAQTNPLGKLPGSVWTIPTEPLRVPDHLGIDHFAAFPTEWPKRIITGWSPAAVCSACGEGRRPTVDRWLGVKERDTPVYGAGNHGSGGSTLGSRGSGARITGYVCACVEPTADTIPAVVLDPFGGTGTTALVAAALGRDAITVDRSADYCRIAQWRTSDRNQIAAVLDLPKRTPEPDEQGALW